MTSLWRILIALMLALPGMQGASACEHHRDASAHARTVHDSMQAHASPCASSTNPNDSNSSCHRTHSLCCMSTCGIHCGALMSSAGMSPRVTTADRPKVGSDPARASFTRAPPVRPPIV
jgi:hypothetical protein